MSIVVTRARADVELLRLLLAARGIEDMRFAWGGNESSAVSLATTLLMEERGPLALVLDAHSLDEDDIEERRIVYHDLMRRGAAGGPFHAFLVVPEIKALLFEDRAFVEGVLGPLDERTFLFGRVKPRALIASRLGPDGCATMIARLAEDANAAAAMARSEIVGQIADLLTAPETWRAPQAPALAL